MIAGADPERPLPHEVAADYVARGWQPVPLKPASKEPKGGKGWHSRRYEPADFEGADNVGVLLGRASDFLVDVDLDVPEARELAEHVLADLPTFGRASARGSHRIVRCEDAPEKSERFEFKGKAAEFARERFGLAAGTESKSVVLELRTSGQTMFPPSLHPKNERVEWPGGKAPHSLPAWSWAEVRERARLIAFLAVVLRAYPRGEGNRDTICLALAGTLIRCGLTDDQVDDAVALVARLAGDEEADRRRGKATPSRAKIDAGEPATGLPQLCELLELQPLEPVLRKWLGLADAAELFCGDDAIVVRGGVLPELVDTAEAALLTAGVGVYQRGETLVRVARVDVSAAEEGIRRDAGATVLVAVREPWLVEQMARAARWLRVNPSGKFVPVDPEPKVAKTLLARVGEWRFPVLRGITRAPTLDADGSVVQQPGYDPRTRLYLDFAEGAFPPVPEQPTREDADAALVKIDALFRDFPFVGDADRSVALSAVLTGLVRRSLRTAPLHGFDAPTAGTGKSLLAETVGVIVTGHRPAAMSQGKSEEEDEKRLSTLLRAGDPILLIDNCERQLSGDFLCSMLTQETVQARILGVSERVILPTSALVLATGNNLTLAGDMTRRAVICRLDAGVERPDAREFGFDPRREAEQTRAELVVAALTVLRAYHVAGKPAPVGAVGSFEDWSLVRGALVWLGRADPAETRAAILANDPRKGELAELLAAWEAAVGDTAMSLAEIWDLYTEHPSDAPALRLVTMLKEAGGRGHWNTKAIGHFLRRQRERVVGGRRLVAVGAVGGAQRWKVDGAARRDDGPAPELF